MLINDFTSQSERQFFDEYHELRVEFTTSLAFSPSKILILVLRHRFVKFRHALVKISHSIDCDVDGWGHHHSISYA